MRNTGQVGVIGDRHIHHHVDVVQHLVEIPIICILAFGTAVTPVVKTVGADSALMKAFCHVVVTPLMLTESVDNHRDGPVSGLGLPIQIQLCPIK